MCLTPSHCSRAILALQVVGDKPLTSWSVVSLGTQHTQAPTPPQTSAHVVRPLEIAPATRAKFVLLRERPVFAAATLAAAVRLEFYSSAKCLQGGRGSLGAKVLGQCQAFARLRDPPG